MSLAGGVVTANGKDVVPRTTEDQLEQPTDQHARANPDFGTWHVAGMLLACWQLAPYLRLSYRSNSSSNSSISSLPLTSPNPNCFLRLSYHYRHSMSMRSCSGLAWASKYARSSPKFNMSARSLGLGLGLGVRVGVGVGSGNR